MIKRKTATILILGIAVIALAALVTAQIAGVQIRAHASGGETWQSPNTSQSPNKSQQQGDPQPEQPTVIEEGVMTEKQKKHSKLFKRYGVLTRGKKLKDSPSESGAVNVVAEVGDRLLPASFDLSTYLHNNACKADAIIVGTVNSKASQLVEDGTFTFTDYEVRVEEVLKNNLASPISADNQITVARAGGAVSLHGRTIRAFDQSERPLGTNGRFLLFLKYIPETGAYQPYISDIGDASFQLRGDKILQVSDEALPLGAGHSVEAASFLTQVRSAVNGACNN